MRYVKITIRALLYAVGFVGVIMVVFFCMFAVFEAVDKLSKWILPTFFCAFVLLVCFIVACAKDEQKRRQKKVRTHDEKE